MVAPESGKVLWSVNDFPSEYVKLQDLSSVLPLRVLALSDSPVSLDLPWTLLVSVLITLEWVMFRYWSVLYRAWKYCV